jgi:hypothetical protein
MIFDVSEKTKEASLREDEGSKMIRSFPQAVGVAARLEKYDRFFGSNASTCVDF